MKNLYRYIDDWENSELLSFKNVKGKFNRSQALEVKRALRRLAQG